MKGVGGLVGGDWWLGRVRGEKGTKIARVSFSCLNTMQHVTVETALVSGKSVLREKNYIINVYIIFDNGVGV